MNRQESGIAVLTPRNSTDKKSVVTTTGLDTSTTVKGIDVREFDMAKAEDRENLIRFISWVAANGKSITVTSNR